MMDIVRGRQVRALERADEAKTFAATAAQQKRPVEGSANAARMREQERRKGHEPLDPNVGHRVDVKA